MAIKVASFVSCQTHDIVFMDLELLLHRRSATCARWSPIYCRAWPYSRQRTWRDRLVPW